jgi:hypothetical protein
MIVYDTKEVLKLLFARDPHWQEFGFGTRYNELQLARFIIASMIC